MQRAQTFKNIISDLCSQASQPTYLNISASHTFLVPAPLCILISFGATMASSSLTKLKEAYQTNRQARLDALFRMPDLSTKSLTPNDVLEIASLVSHENCPSGYHNWLVLRNTGSPETSVYFNEGKLIVGTYAEVFAYAFPKSKDVSRPVVHTMDVASCILGAAKHDGLHSRLSG
jgi:hypothetical protein